MTAWLENSVKTFTKTYLPNNFRLRILGNKKVLKKSQIEWRQILVPSSPSRNKVLVIADKNYTEADFQSFLVLSNFAWFYYLVPNILSSIVDVYYFMEELVTMGASFKTILISCIYIYKKGDLI